MRLERFTRAEIAAYYAARVPELKQTPSNEWRSPCPIHSGERDSFAVNRETGCWYCHAECGRGGSIIKLEMEISGVDLKTAKNEVLRIIGRTWRTRAKYVYTDESGNNLFRVVRRERGEGGSREKTFHQERCERGRWKKGLANVRRVPYRLHKVVNAKRVFIVEGEKDVDTLRKKFGVTATTNPMGAGKWLPEFARYFSGKDIIILPDNDDPGRRHALRVAESVLPVAASVRIIELPDLSEKGDVTDWARARGTRHKLNALVNEARPLDGKSLVALRERWNLNPTQVGPNATQFRLTADAVTFIDGQSDNGLKICGHLQVAALTRDEKGDGWGRLLNWTDSEDREHAWAMPMTMFAGDGTDYRARLLDGGLFIAPGRRARDLLTEYIQSEQPEGCALCVSRVGWHGKNFVLPSVTIGPMGAEAVLFQTPYESDHFFSVSGTVEDWRHKVGRLCRGNSRLIFAASCAFAGPVLGLMGAESGGVHLFGPSSSGKTTALVVGGSVLGGGGRNGFVQSWAGTKNGLEAVAELHNDLCLFLDELSQMDPREAGDTAYLLGNGYGKQRMNRNIGARRRLAWRLLFISAGEITLSDHVQTAGKRVRAGAEVRLLNIDADAGAGLGLFENLHGAKSADAFARRLKRAAQSYYGAPLRAWLAYLTGDQAAAKDALNKRRLDFFKEHTRTIASGEVSRAAQRFALIGAAGELATMAGITGWVEGESTEAAARCFHAWLSNRGTSSGADMEAAVRQVRAFLEAHGGSRFQTLQPDPMGEHAALIRNRAGFRRLNSASDETQYLILPEVFKREVCSGYDPRAVLKELEQRGFLIRTPPDFTIKTRLPELGNVRVYCIRARILEGKA
jgi:uncharacterized protein (DUF927 family)